MTWFLIPFVWAYYDAGEFTVKGRLKSALRSNFWFFVIAGVRPPAARPAGARACVPT
jgi:hypothetical protein